MPPPESRTQNTPTYQLLHVALRETLENRSRGDLPISCLYCVHPQVSGAGVKCSTLTEATLGDSPAVQKTSPYCLHETVDAFIPVWVMGGMTESSGTSEAPGCISPGLIPQIDPQTLRFTVGDLPFSDKSSKCKWRMLIKGTLVSCTAEFIPGHVDVSGDRSGWLVVTPVLRDVNSHKAPFVLKREKNNNETVQVLMDHAVVGAYEIPCMAQSCKLPPELDIYQELTYGMAARLQPLLAMCGAHSSDITCKHAHGYLVFQGLATWRGLFFTACCLTRESVDKFNGIDPTKNATRGPIITLHMQHQNDEYERQNFTVDVDNITDWENGTIQSAWVRVTGGKDCIKITYDAEQNLITTAIDMLKIQQWVSDLPEDAETERSCFTKIIAASRKNPIIEREICRRVVNAAKKISQATTLA